MSEQHEGSFLGGLALGLFAGAAGYFLFATKDGAKVRRDVEQEWVTAKVKLAEDGLIKDKNMTFSQMVSEWLGLATPLKAQPKKKSSKNTAPASSSKTAKFKGV